MREASQMTQELNIATKYATGKEAVLANFNGKGKAAMHERNDEDNDGASPCH